MVCRSRRWGGAALDLESAAEVEGEGGGVLFVDVDVLEAVVGDGPLDEGCADSKALPAGVDEEHFYRRCLQIIGEEGDDAVAFVVQELRQGFEIPAYEGAVEVDVGGAEEVVGCADGCFPKGEASGVGSGSVCHCFRGLLVSMYKCSAFCVTNNGVCGGKCVSSRLFSLLARGRWRME